MFYGAAFLFSLALLLFAVLDCIATEASLCRYLPKPLWIMLIIFLPTVGSVAWLLLGRPEKTTSYPGHTSSRPGPPAARPRRPLGPDDDPRFAEMSGGTARSAPGVPAKEPEPAKEPAGSDPPTTPSDANPSDTPGPEHGVNELRAWEEDLRRREEELRRKLEGSIPPVQE